MKKIIYLGSLLTLFSCSNEKKSTQSTLADTVRITAGSGPSQRPGPVSNTPTSKSAPADLTGKWTYQQTVDKDGHAIYKATTLSPDSLTFGFPYAAGSTASLTIRQRDSGTTLYLQVSNGQFNRSFQGGQARIRFDNQPEKGYAFSAAANGSANIIFFDAVQPLIARLKEAQQMSIDVEFYAQGKRRIRFRTAGLEWNH